MFVEELPHRIHGLLLVLATESVSLTRQYQQFMRRSSRFHFFVEDRRLFNRNERITIAMQREYGRIILADVGNGAGGLVPFAGLFGRSTHK